MGYAYTKKLIPWLIFPALTLFNVPPVRCDDGEFRDIVRNPLSDDELMQARRNAFSGDGESAYLVYMQLTAHELDLDARAYLRLAAELGYCMAVHEVRDSIRNQDGRSQESSATRLANSAISLAIISSGVSHPRV